MNLIWNLWRDEGGGLISAEYVLIGTLLTIGLVVGVRAVQEALIDKISQITSSVCP